MANSPVQIILNSNDFITSLDNNPGGGEKDFFAGNDGEFVKHKAQLQNQLLAIKDIQQEEDFGQISYAKVSLQQSALAKSHRPTGQIFKRNTAPVIGGGDLGEIYVELTQRSIDSLVGKVGEAEVETRYKQRDGKTVASPSQLRSEVGAIKEILPYAKSDKRKFSVDEAVSWLESPETNGVYLVELFQSIPHQKDWDLLNSHRLKLIQSFIEGLKKLSVKLNFFNTTTGLGNVSLYGIRLEEGKGESIIQLHKNIAFGKGVVERPVDLNLNAHLELLNFLDIHPLVKKIMLPPIITTSNTTTVGKKIDQDFIMPMLDDNYSFPKIGVIDGGVSKIYGDWIEENWGYLSPSDRDEDHGTFISGLLLFGNSLNGDEICQEVDGCKIIDLDLLPKKSRFETYYQSPLQFFDELEAAVQDLKARTGVRIFNFSLNFEEHASTSGYSVAAQRLDKIAEENDVIFVISAGNTTTIDTRKEWPTDNFEALKILASSRNDTIKKPAESCRNLSVSALNPPNMTGVVPYALSNYSCRGPGLRVGLKPDLAHIGGSGTKCSSSGAYGLLSLDATGNVIDGCGTSYAAPNVAKTLACIDNAIEGVVSRETLMALSIHNSRLPECLSDKKLKNIAKDLIGFGIPKGSLEILEGDTNSITLVFANRITHGNKMSFNFAWPASLVKNGKCLGFAKLTVISTPQFDYRYGAEFVRVNIEASLRQQQKDGNYKGQLKAIYTPEGADISKYEKDQIEHGFKWSPVKVYEKAFPKGVGPTTDWRLEVEYLTRDGVVLPVSGVPFTVILTISDPKKEAPVFNDMRQMLQTIGAQAVDIQTAARVTSRV
ncbi:S8 family peptidase [Pedobacter polysacchareus]|uniref:S8 family peptidase n=1 Tax=Pedobacter polysacchareus TaxID=2861973 RepID=UPI001C99949B|nr:S8 family peptidase [Pedobacter polysacchareus]